jgi:hypothetical protein
MKVQSKITVKMFENSVCLTTFCKHYWMTVFFFHEIVNKKVLNLQKLINAQYQIKAHRPELCLKKNKRTCLLIIRYQDYLLTFEFVCTLSKFELADQ